MTRSPTLTKPVYKHCTRRSLRLLWLDCQLKVQIKIQNIVISFPALIYRLWSPSTGRRHTKPPTSSRFFVLILQFNHTLYVRVFLYHLYNSYGKSKDHRETWKCCDVLQKPRSNVKRCMIMNGGVAGVAGASLSFHTRVAQNISINCELRS